MSELINRINSLFVPLENILRTYKNYIGFFFLFLAVLSFGFFWIQDGVKQSGEKAILILWIILWIPIFARVFGLKVFQLMMPLRQELGILMGTLAFVHAGLVIFPSPQFLLSPYFWLSDSTILSYLAFGFFAFIISIPLTLTSNTWMMHKMGRYWKLLHRTVYLLIILVVMHVVLIEWVKYFKWEPVALLVAYFSFKILEWRGFSFAAKDIPKFYPKGQKWFCVPCGYIYDPVVGDESEGIKAGTEFSDIPEDWRCPDCGVTKADFVPVEDDSRAPTEYGARIVDKVYLNHVTLKLVIELVDDLKSIPGQFATFMFSDNEGEFTRSYSIAEHTGRRLTFLIKLTDLGRGARLLRNIETDAIIRIRGIFGGFILQDTSNPKVFVATGTGLSPIYNMIRSILVPIIQCLSRDPADPGVTGFLPPQEGYMPHVQLYFTVATCNELFYTDELRAIEGLDLHIHTTREETPECHYGRVNIDNIVATPDTEWYLCGSPKMVEEASANLRARGYEKIYSEEFN